MRIGILETGRPPEELDRHGSYPEMFERLLGPDFAYRAFPVVDGVFPERVDEMNGWLVTGSRFGAYDPEPWIRRLEDFLRDALAARIPVVGICFGHQVLASALGARVEKAEAGWGVGPHTYRILERPHWMEGDAKAEATSDFTLNTMHQDQVLTLPEGGRLIATSAFCPIAGLAYGDRAISFQPHPEFDNAFERELIQMRRGTLVPEERAEPALRALKEGSGADGEAPDADRVARWIRRFFRSAAGASTDKS